MKFPVAINSKTAKSAGITAAVVGLSAIGGAVAGPLSERIPGIGPTIAAQRIKGGATRKVIDGAAAAALAFAALFGIAKAQNPAAAQRASLFVLGGTGAGYAIAAWQPTVQTTLVAAINRFLPARAPMVQASTAPRLVRAPLPVKRLVPGGSVPMGDTDYEGAPTVSVGGYSG